MKKNKKYLGPNIGAKFIILMGMTLTLSSCALFGAKESGIALSPKDWKVSSSEPQTTLAEYYAKFSELPRRADLIACAAGGHMSMKTGAAEPVSVFFYPKDKATDIRIFEAKSLQTDTLDFANFEEKRWPVDPVFNGYLRRYRTDYLKRETWMVITSVTNDTLHTSGMIHLRVDTQPTKIDMMGVSMAEATDGLQFQWPDDSTAAAQFTDSSPADAVYFEVVSNSAGDLVSGTYTRQPNFTFYDTKNVFINIRDIDPPPSLESGQNYEFMVMAVSGDNWVNRILKREFVAP